jgi:hypothetical protein
LQLHNISTLPLNKKDILYLLTGHWMSSSTEQYHLGNIINWIIIINWTTTSSSTGQQHQLDNIINWVTSSTGQHHQLDNRRHQYNPLGHLASRSLTGSP